MDIYKFLNSKDVADYLKSIDYKFSALQSAVLVYHSQKMSVKQKIAAWKEIIATMPDCDIPEDEDFEREPSLHEYLKRCIDDFVKMQKDFFTEGEYVYTYRYREEVVPGMWNDCGDIFTNYKALDKDVGECQARITKNFGEPNETTKIIPTVRYWVRKQSTEDTSDVMIADFYKGKMTNCTRGYRDTAVDRLKFVYIDIPTPFKCGDILKLKEHYGGYNSEFVLYCMPNWTKDEYIKNGVNYEREIENKDSILDVKGEYRELSAYAYFAGDDGEVYHQHPSPYFDFEYYRGGLVGQLAVLKGISEYLKGGKGLEFLLNRYMYEVTKYKNEGREFYAGVEEKRNR